MDVLLSIVPGLVERLVKVGLKAHLKVVLLGERAGCLASLNLMWANEVVCVRAWVTDK